MSQGRTKGGEVMSRVVVGFDGSNASMAALRWAAAHASRWQLPLRVVHVVAPAVASDGFGYVVPVDVEVFKTIMTSAQNALDEAMVETRATFPKLEIETEVRSGSASAELIKEAGEASLVVVGSRGRGGFRGLLLGSVSTQVATHGTAPTVVIREGTSLDGGGSVVVGVDGSELSSEALAFAFEIASMRGLPLTAVHAWEVPTVDLVAMPGSTLQAMSEFEHVELRTAAESIAGFAEKFPDVEVRDVLAKGSPVIAILDADPMAELIVVGSRGHGEFVGAVLGSVSQAVLHRARVPVAVVPHRTARSEER